MTPLELGIGMWLVAGAEIYARCWAGMPAVPEDDPDEVECVVRDMHPLPRYLGAVLCVPLMPVLGTWIAFWHVRDVLRGWDE